MADDLLKRSEIVAELRVYVQNTYRQVKEWPDKEKALESLAILTLDTLDRTERRLLAAEKEKS